jgi:hypothetical protein
MENDLCVLFVVLSYFSSGPKVSFVSALSSVRGIEQEYVIDEDVSTITNVLDTCI